MALRTQPAAEDGTHGVRARPVSFYERSRPPDVDRSTDDRTRSPNDIDITPLAGSEFEQASGMPDQAPEPPIDFLQLVREAEQQALLYTNQANRRAWTRAFMAWHNEHFSGSKYTRPDWRNRSKLFIPKTRSAVRKDMAAVAASLFNTLDAVTCLPGDDANPLQRGAAAVMQELVNYRTDRTSGKAALPWFQIALGARQDSMLTGICLSKQYWKLEFRKQVFEQVTNDEETGTEYSEHVERFSPDIDRPDIIVFPPENFIIDPAAEWTDPVQSASYIILKYPMRMEDIRRRQNSPYQPWRPVPPDTLRTTLETSKYDMAAIRRAREFGLDRLDETQTGIEFQIIWIYEVFMKMDGEDWTFISAGTSDYLTEPRPVREVYPEQAGERPLCLGYGALEAHRIFPMSPVDSWMPLQMEMNDIRNLALDATKQNVMPVSKIRRGRQIDIDQVRRRSYGTSIIVNDPTDVTWEQPPQVPQAVTQMNRDLSLEFDDLAGQFNAGTTENNNALSRTLGGLRLVAGTANAVQEFDIRVWLMTWCQPALAQLVRLEQFYENDPIVLGLCGERAKLMQKHGIDQITDELLEQEVTIRVSIGLGAGDPQMRLMKFQSAVQIAAPLLQSSPKFMSGEMQLDTDAIIAEIFGGAGYADGGKRFFIHGQPQQNPMNDLQVQRLQAEIDKIQRQGKASMINALASAAKVNLGDRELEAMRTNQLLDAQLRAMDMGHQHGGALHDRMMAARDAGHRHGLELAEHRHDQTNSQHDRMMDMLQQLTQGQQQPAGGGDGGAEGQAQPQQQGVQPKQLLTALKQLRTPSTTDVKFTRDPRTGRISGAQIVKGF